MFLRGTGDVGLDGGVAEEMIYKIAIEKTTALRKTEESVCLVSSISISSSSSNSDGSSGDPKHKVDGTICTRSSWTRVLEL